MTAPTVSFSRPSSVVYPDAGEDRIALLMAEFYDLREMVNDLSDPLIHWSNWATAFFGAAIGLGAAYLGMPHPEGGKAYIVVGVAAVACAVLTVFMGWVGWQMRKTTTTDKKHLMRTMDRLEKTCPRFAATPDQHRQG